MRTRTLILTGLDGYKTVIDADALVRQLQRITTLAPGRTAINLGATTLLVKESAEIVAQLLTEATKD